MKAFLDSFGAVIGSATIGLLLMSVSHEYGYFFAVGQHFQTILTTTDYFSNAVLWLPLMALGLYAFLDWDVLVGRRYFKPFGLHWGSLWWGLLVIVWPIGALFLSFAGYGPWIWAFIILWLMYGVKLLPFVDSLTADMRVVRRVLVIAPVVVAFLFSHGFSNGKDDLKTFDSPYSVDLKSGGTVYRILLRTLDKGVLVRDPINTQVEFIKWEEISRLRHSAKLDVTPRACKWFGLNCAEGPTP